MHLTAEREQPARACEEGRATRPARRILTVQPANLRDLAYIAANMRPADRAEVECQLDRWDATAIAAMSLQGYAYTVELDGNPEAAFGAGQVRQGYWIAWSWGTRKLWRCLPAMIDYIEHDLQPRVYADGARRVEARALSSHSLAHRFLERIGGHRRCDLPAYGKNGEDFVLYDWTRESWGKHVLLQDARDAKAGAATARSAA
jgi:hypothetical protein